MSSKNRSGIEIRKTLHLENALVNSMHYTAFDTPVLTETVKVGGETRVRVSEDNGKTWSDQGAWNAPEQKGARLVITHPPVYCLDSRRRILIEFVTKVEKAQREKMSFGPDGANDYLELRTSRILYRISRDEGQTWGPQKQLVQKGAQYDETHWADEVCYGKNSCNFDGLLRAVVLSDGTIILPVWFWRVGKDGELDKKVDRFGEMIWPGTGSACFCGMWRGDRGDFDWHMSNHLSVPEYMSRNLGEPAVAELPDGKLMVVMRGSSDVRQAMSGVKFFAISKDRGKTWNPPVPLTYPDHSLVHSPGSLANLFRSSKNGKLYLITNILSETTRGADPRNRLQIAEIDPENRWVIPETVTVIDKHRKHHPGFVRFSNWQRIEDRRSGNPVIYMTESRTQSGIPDTPGTICPHSFRYEIAVPE